MSPTGAPAVPVPSTLDELLEPAWLTAALAPRFPGIEVTGVVPGPVISRVATNARFRIECAGGRPAGLSPDLCAKGYFSEVGRPFRHVGEPEVCFYRDIVERTGVRTLRSVYADVDPVTHHGVLITEDVVPRGATFLDALSEYSPDQAAQSLEQFATLHAATWGDPALADAAWLASRLASYSEVRGIDEVRYNFDGPIGARVPDAARQADRLVQGFERIAASIGSVPTWSVIHGDAHVGNLFLDGEGRPSLVDWQLVQRGPWYLDVGYHMASALTVADRRASERDLVDHYLDRLAAGGVEAPSAAEARSAIRYGMVYGFYLWAITLKVDPAITATLLERLGTATADHEALDAVLSGPGCP